MKPRPVPRLPVAGICLALGACGVLVAALLGARELALRQTHAPVAGVVVENDRRCRKGCSYRPVVEYGVDGGRYAVIGTVGNSTPVFEVGEAVTVLVSPREPRDARIDHWTESLFGIALAGGLGALFGGIGLLLRYQALNKGSRHG